jgi:hypothetical protein
MRDDIGAKSGFPDIGMEYQALSFTFKNSTRVVCHGLISKNIQS